MPITRLHVVYCVTKCRTVLERVIVTEGGYVKRKGNGGECLGGNLIRFKALFA